MGYNTEFEGQFDFNKPLDDDTYNLLQGLATTRRMKRKVDEEKYGKDGEFYIEGKGFMGQDHEDNILDYNNPPGDQPGLWLQWVPTDDRLHLEWDEGEKFYYYVEWLEYLIKKIFEPRGYVLNGEVSYRGEDFDDVGTIVVRDNKVSIRAWER